MILRAENIVKKYKSRTVVKDVSIEVKQGEIVGLLGPNGAGKTTSFYIIVGLVKPNAGKVFLEDEDITKVPMYKRSKMGLGYLPQEASVFRKLSVEDNIMAVLEMTDLTKQERLVKLESLLDEFGLQVVRSNRGDLLSGGERRRTEIARALAVDPQFILLDEPFAGVDPIAVEDIQNIVSKLKDKGLGILITDHNVQETLSITDRAYLLFEGSILKAGTAEELANDEQVRKVYLGKNFKLKNNTKGNYVTELLSTLEEYENFELAFMYKYKYNSYSATARVVIDSVFEDRKLDPNNLDNLLTQVNFDSETPHCSRCSSSKLLSVEEELWNTKNRRGSLIDDAAAIDGFSGKATMVTKITCGVCGQIVSDPNKKDSDLGR